MKYWLFKSEPSCFSFEDLQNMPHQTEHWDGVRNYQARNFLRDEIQEADKVLFYHSSCKTPGVVGTATVVRSGYPDHTAFDPQSDHPDLDSNPENPRWFMVDIQANDPLPKPLSLQEIKNIPELYDMQLVKRGNRLSLFPITKEHYTIITQLGGL